jgi:hypothetical protein
VTALALSRELFCLFRRVLAKRYSHRERPTRAWLEVKESPDGWRSFLGRPWNLACF